MDPKIQAQLDSLDRELQQLLEELRPYSEEMLNRVPGPGQWSPLQVMQHLKRSEELSLQYLRKKLSNPAALKRAGIATFLRDRVLDIYLDAPFKFKAPKVVNPETFPEQVTLAELGASWQELRGKIRQFLSMQPEGVFRTEAYKHPFAGRITLKGMLTFFEAHFRRHRKQLRKAIQSRKSEVGIK